MKILLGIIVTFVIGTLANKNENQPFLHGMQAFRIFCDSEKKLDLIRTYENHHGFDFTAVSKDENISVDVFVAAENLTNFKMFLMTNNIHYEIFIDDVAKVIEEQYTQQKLARLNSKNSNILDYFPRYDEIKSYLKSLVKKHGDVIQLLNIGTTYEGREIIGVKISSGGSVKPAVFFDGGIHAREWISVTTVIYAIQQLVENTTNRYIFENVDIYIVPSINPDGYEYSHQNSSTRMWRKTRAIRSFEDCIGVDLNRNFAYGWKISNPCDETYSGPESFSELESTALKNFILAHKDELKIYINFHSYGNYMLYPWASKPELPENERTLHCVAAKAEAELAKIRNTRYRVGNHYNTLYPVNGGTLDWVLDNADVDLSYIIELPNTKYGFLAPLEEIVPTGRETFEAIKVFIQYAEGKICNKM